MDKDYSLTESLLNNLKQRLNEQSYLYDSINYCLKRSSTYGISKLAGNSGPIIGCPWITIDNDGFIRLCDKNYHGGRSDIAILLTDDEDVKLNASHAANIIYKLTPNGLEQIIPRKE